MEKQNLLCNKYLEVQTESNIWIGTDRFPRLTSGHYAEFVEQGESVTPEWLDSRFRQNCLNDISSDPEKRLDCASGFKAFHARMHMEMLQKTEKYRDLDLEGYYDLMMKAHNPDYIMPNYDSVPTMKPFMAKLDNQ